MRFLRAVCCAGNAGVCAQSAAGTGGHGMVWSSRCAANTAVLWRACCSHATALSALLFTLPAEGGEGAATADAALPHLQARLSDTVHVRRKTRLVAQIAAVPDAVGWRNVPLHA